MRACYRVECGSALMQGKKISGQSLWMRFKKREIRRKDADEGERKIYRSRRIRTTQGEAEKDIKIRERKAKMKKNRKSERTRAKVDMRKREKDSQMNR